METFLQMLRPRINLIYHCFDRMVINGYLFMLSRPEQIVYFFKNVVGVKALTKEVISERTECYRNRIERFAKENRIPMEWAKKGVRKEDYVLPYQKEMKREKAYGVYFIFKSMEQGNTFRSHAPKYKTANPDFRKITKSRSRFTYYYFYIMDEIMGPMVIRVGSFFPFEVTAYLNGHNFIEQKLNEMNIGFTKKDNAFSFCSDVKKLQEIADSMSPETITERLDHQIKAIGPVFSEYEQRRMGLKRFYAMMQMEYCTNFIFHNNHPIRKLFQRSCELGMLTITASRISNVFGTRITRQLKGKLQTVLNSIDHAHYSLRAYFKKSFIKQYEKMRTFLRVEVCTNNTRDLKVKKSLNNLPQLRSTAIAITDRFAQLQANIFNIHVDLPLLSKLADPVTVGQTKIAGIQLHNQRMQRLMETLMHFGTSIDGLTTAAIHNIITERYELETYSFNQLRYDIRKLKAHGLVKRYGRRYSYLLTEKGARMMTLYVLFHKRLYEPLANSLFGFKIDNNLPADTSLEKAYRKADKSIGKLIDLLAA